MKNSAARKGKKMSEMTLEQYTQEVVDKALTYMRDELQIEVEGTAEEVMSNKSTAFFLQMVVGVVVSSFSEAQNESNS